MTRLRLPLSLAWRDIRAHRLASAVIVAMIGLPVMILVASLTLLATLNIDGREALPGIVGSAQARVTGRFSHPITQSPAGSSVKDSCGERGGILGETPGWTPDPTWLCEDAPEAPGVVRVGSTQAAAADIVRRETGATAVLPVRTVTTGLERRPNRPVTILEVDGRDPLASGMVTLSSGRWPAAANEVLATRSAMSGHLTDAGGFVSAAPTEGRESTATAFTVVGTVALAPGAARPTTPDFVRLPTEGIDGLTFLVDRPEPYTWADVERLNKRGLLVVSRAVVEDPPTTALDETDGTLLGGSGAEVLTVVTVILLLEGCLVAGPAFAVTASRRRRDLALLAATGARVSDLRRILVTQAVLLGAFSALIGSLLGMGVVPVGLAAVESFFVFEHVAGPWQVPWAPVLAVTCAAVAASLLAGAIPSRGLGRLDLRAAVDSEGAAPVAPRRTHLAIGLGLFTLGLALWWYVSAEDLGQFGGDATPDIFSILGAGLSSVIGAVLLVPATLHTLARLSRHSRSVTARLALRDADRRRSRTVPSVAAVMAGSILLSGLGILVASLSSAEIRDHRPVGPHGSVVVPVTDASARRIADEIGRLAPGATTVTVERPAPETAWLVAPATCPWSPTDSPSGEACRGAAGDLAERSLVVMTPEAAATLIPLTAADRDALARGEALVSQDSHDPSGTLVVTRADSAMGSDDPPRGRRVGTLTGRRLIPTSWLLGNPIGAIITPATAKRVGMTVADPVRILWQPGGSLPEAALTAAENASDTSGSAVLIERGPTGLREMQPVLIVLATAFSLLTVVAVSTSTLLGLAESRRDMAVLTAVGATRSMARRMAAAQAGLLAGIGSVLGFVVAFAPAVAVAVSGTTEHPQNEPTFTYLDHLESATVVIPWAQAALVLLLVCAVAAGCAALFTRPAPAVSRRPS